MNEKYFFIENCKRENIFLTWKNVDNMYTKFINFYFFESMLLKAPIWFSY